MGCLCPGFFRDRGCAARDRVAVKYIELPYGGIRSSIIMGAFSVDEPATTIFELQPAWL
jgi:hypothetical protein